MSVAEKRSVVCFARNTCDIPDDLTVIEDIKAVPPPDNGMFRIMSKEGDTRVVWNRLSLVELRSAKEMFDDLISKGMVPYHVGEDGQASPTEMAEFDPSAEEVIFMPMQLVCGG